jgi:hypothetical protein
MIKSKTSHSKAFIFICPKRTFLLEDDGKIPSQPTPVDYWTEEGKCSYCLMEKEVN